MSSKQWNLLKKTDLTMRKTVGRLLCSIFMCQPEQFNHLQKLYWNSRNVLSGWHMNDNGFYDTKGMKSTTWNNTLTILTNVSFASLSSLAVSSNFTNNSLEMTAPSADQPARHSRKYTDNPYNITDRCHIY